MQPPASPSSPVPGTLSQAEFARRIGWNKSTVTRAKQAGRLVLTADGQVDTDASIQRLRETTKGRVDLSDYWAAQRAASAASTAAPADAPPSTAGASGSLPPPPPAPSAAPPSPPGAPLDTDEIGRRTRYAQMLKAEAEARTKAREDLLAQGQVIPRATVAKDLTDAVALILTALDGLPERYAPVLTGVADQAQMRAMLNDATDQIRAEVATRLSAIAKEPTP